MSGRPLLNISERVNLAFHALGFLAAYDGDFAPVGWIAQAMPVSSLYLAKVLQPLARAGVVSSKRGPTGGYSLLKKPEDISLYDLVMFYEEELPDNGCLFAHRTCANENCGIHKLNAALWAKMKKELRQITVAQIRYNLPKRNNSRL